jgi:hypothetical protein
VKQPSRLADTLIDSFVSLPSSDSKLSDQQLQAIFGGDINAIHELVQLAHQSDDTAQ